MVFKLFETKDAMQRMLQNNEPRLVIAGNRNICVVRQKDRLVAFENECPHMKEGLSGGAVNYLNEIVCPLHTYKFNLETGMEERQRCSELRFIKVDMTEEGVFLNLT
ncbi:MAG: Rieske 2Fe-2S domain-containing protein [Cyclobacteriaceae bacterium]